MIARLLPTLLLLAALPLRAEIEVEIEGLDSELRENVEERLSIRAAAEREDLDGILVQSLHQQAEAEIRRALQPYGHYEPSIESRLSGEAPDWRAHYRVDAGPQTRIRRLDIQMQGEGATQTELQLALVSLSLREGQPLLHSRYEAAKLALQQAAYNAGYLDAAYTRAELRVEPQARSADVLLTLDTGLRYFFGAITVEPQGLDEGFVRRYILLTPGEPFDPQQVLKTQFALSDLDYFQTVEMQPQRDKMEAQRLPLHIHTTPRARRRYEIGAGYGTDTGPRVTAAAEFRRLGSHGHKLRAETRIAEQKRTVGGEYRVPLGRKPGDSISFTGASTYEKFIDGDSLKYSIGASLSRTPGDWQRRVYLLYEHEESDIAGARREDDQLIPGFSLNRTEADDPIHTMRGWSLFADVHGTNKDLLSTASYLQARTLLRGAYPLGPRWRLLGRAELGANLVADFSELPISQRFFAGGDQSVRGYAYQSLGPRDAAGNVIGGKFLTTLSVETDYRFRGDWSNWGVAAFADAGGANDDPGPELSVGVGAGLRYRAPIGYLNLDLAHPLHDEARNLRVHISVRVGL